MTSKHPQRCETCKHRDADRSQHPPAEYSCYCNLKRMWVHMYCNNWIGYVGCASHSSAMEPAGCCDIETIKPQPECFGHWKGIDSDCNCHVWGYCADITIRAQAARDEVLDAVKEHCQKGIFNMNRCVVNDTRGNPIEEVHTQRADERRETYKDIIRFSESLRSGGK